jgi:hypothetical protein
VVWPVHGCRSPELALHMDSPPNSTTPSYLADKKNQWKLHLLLIWISDLFTYCLLHGQLGSSTQSLPFGSGHYDMVLWKCCCCSACVIFWPRAIGLESERN